MKLAPGVTVDDDGTLHLDATVMCIAAGYEPNDENKEMLVRAARKTFAGADVEVRP